MYYKGEVHIKYGCIEDDPCYVIEVASGFFVEVERERDKAPTPLCGDGAQASPAPVLEGRRPGLIVHAHAGSLLSAVRQSTTDGELYRD